jgi:hypothetical protein
MRSVSSKGRGTQRGMTSNGFWSLHCFSAPQCDMHFRVGRVSIGGKHFMQRVFGIFINPYSFPAWIL